MIKLFFTIERSFYTTLDSVGRLFDNTDILGEEDEKIIQNSSLGELIVKIATEENVAVLSC